MSTSLSVARSTLRPDLGQTMEAIDLTEQKMGLIGLRVAPVFDVLQQAGTFTKLPIESLLVNPPDTSRNADGSYNTLNGTADTDNYATKENGLAERVDERERNMLLSYFDAEQIAASRVVHANLLAHTTRVISAITALTFNGTNSANAAAKWNTGSASPIKDVDTGRITMRNTYGIKPNAMVLEWEAFLAVRREPQILDALFGSVNPENSANVTAAMLAQVFDLDEVIVSESQKNTANEAKAAVLAASWDKTLSLLFRKEDGNDLKRPQFMRTFHWSADGSNLGETFESYYSEEKRSDYVRHRMDTQEKVLYAPAAYEIKVVL